MKNSYSISQRNQIVEEHLWCIDSLLDHSRPLLRVARLEYEDAYQELALYLIEAVSNYDPDLGQLEPQIFAQLRTGLYRSMVRSRRNGLAEFPGHLREMVLSWSALANAELLPQELTA